MCSAGRGPLPRGAVSAPLLMAGLDSAIFPGCMEPVVPAPALVKHELRVPSGAYHTSGWGQAERLRGQMTVGGRDGEAAHTLRAISCHFRKCKKLSAFAGVPVF